MAQFSVEPGGVGAVDGRWLAQRGLLARVRPAWHHGEALRAIDGAPVPRPVQVLSQSDVSRFSFLVNGVVGGGTVSSLAPIPLFAWLITTRFIVEEEKALTETFGQSYLDYKRRVRRWV